jgi:hypothetical protein
MVDPAIVTKSYAGDACMIGGGGYHGKDYWSRPLSVRMQGDNPPIHCKEFFVLIISTRIWGPSWTGLTVELFCLHQKPKDPEMAKFLREFLYLVVTFKFIPVVKKIGTKDNWVAEYVSRVFEQEAHKFKI